MKTEHITNLEDKIYELAENYGEVEVNPDGEYYNNTLEIAIKTLTECSDPSVNYYDDGYDSIHKFIEIIKKELNLQSEFIEDIDINANGWDCWISWHGWLKITLQ